MLETAHKKEREKETDLKKQAAIRMTELFVNKSSEATLWLTYLNIIIKNVIKYNKKQNDTLSFGLTQITYINYKNIYTIHKIKLQVSYK